MAIRPTVEVTFAHNGDRLLDLLRKQHPDYHPILSIAKIAHDADQASDKELALKAHTTVLRYVEPELKSVEVTQSNPRGRVIEVSLFDDSAPAAPMELQDQQAALVNRIIDVEFSDSETDKEREAA